MRNVVFGGANSLDNYFARKDHSTDWLRWNDEAAAVTAAYWKTFDTVLMGRKTYEVALRLCSGNQVLSPMTGMTLPLPEASADAGELRALSRQRFGLNQFRGQLCHLRRFFGCVIGKTFSRGCTMPSINVASFASAAAFSAS